MLRTSKELQQFAIAASDGICARVVDFYFDDDAWVIRFFILDMESESGQRLIMSPHAITGSDWTARRFRVALTQDQIHRCGDVGTGHTEWQQPVRGHSSDRPDGSRWNGSFLKYLPQAGVAGDPLLRSANAILGADLNAGDGKVGQLSGFLVDDQTWAIRYAVVDTSHWWHGHEVIIAPEWIDEVEWAERRVRVDFSRQAVKESPSYASNQPLDRAHELSTHRHYGRHGYWPRETRTARDPYANRH